jgi:hypothetical protein
MKIERVVANLLLVLCTLPLTACGRPDAKITFRVVTDAGQPVSGATVGMGTFDHHVPGSEFGRDVSKGVRGVTDTNGVVELECESLTGIFGYRIHDQPKYYMDQVRDYRFKEVKGGKWQPWNPRIDMVWKPIVNPVAPYVGAFTVPIPESGKFIGFDLMVGDWVAPYGKGLISDFKFNFVLKDGFTSQWKPFDSTLTLEFANEGDGIQSVIAEPTKGSHLYMPRYAPEDGYEPRLLKRLYREEGKPIEPPIRQDQNYFFRVRTVKKDGKIVSALYGKIHGDIGAGFFNPPKVIIVFSSWLNPTPLDRNMEFDYERNLLKPIKGKASGNSK